MLNLIFASISLLATHAPLPGQHVIARVNALPDKPATASKLMPAGHNKSPDRILVGFHNASWALARKKSVGLGKVTEKYCPGIYVLELNSAVNEDTARRLLQSRGALAFPWNISSLDQSSLQSVRRQLDFALFADGLAGKDSEATDYLEALQYFLQYRVNSKGYIDPETLRGASLKRQLMSPAQMGGMTPFIASPETWDFVGPVNLAVPYRTYFGSTPPSSGRVTCAAVQPDNTNVIYVGTGGGGIWKTTDGGASWTCITDKSPWLYSAVSSIAIDPTNTQIIYAGTGDYNGFFNAYSQGIMKSTDGGQTWTNYGDAQFGAQTVSNIQISPGNHLGVTVTTGNGAGNKYGGFIWHSTDGGQTWTQALNVNSSWSALIYAPAAPELVAAGAANNGIQLYSSADGSAWAGVGNPETTEDDYVSLAPSLGIAGSDRTIQAYWYVFGATNKALSMFTGTLSPLPLPNAPPFNDANNWKQFNYDYCLGETGWRDPSNITHDMLFLGLITMAQGEVTIYPDDTYDSTWTDVGLSRQANAVLHSDQHVAIPLGGVGAPNALIGNDAGLFRATRNLTTGALTFTSLNGQLGTTQFYAIAPHPTDPNRIIGGTQDNASPAALGDLGNWECLRGGDGGWCAWDAPHGYYYTTSNRVVLRYTAPNSFTGISPVDGNGNANWGDRTQFVMPMLLSNTGLPMVGTYRLLKYSGTGQNWIASSPDLTAGATANTSPALRTMATAPSDNNVLYTGSTDGYIWYTSDLGATTAGWHRIDGNVLSAGPNGIPVGAISVNSQNAHDVLVGLGAQSANTHLIWCPDTTQATPTWTYGDPNNELPNVPVNAIQRSPYDPWHTWYVATDVGVFVTIDAGNTWTNATEPLGLPTTIVDDLKIGAGYLYAGTFGRGIWRITIPTDAVLQSLNLNVNSTPGGKSAVGTVSVGVPAVNTTGMTLSSSNTMVVKVPGSVAVSQGSATATFAVTTVPVDEDTPVTVTASHNGVQKTATITVQTARLASLYLPSSVTGGNNVIATVYLTTVAPTRGFLVSLKSSSSAAVPPTSVTVPAGSAYKSFNIATLGVAGVTAATITASGGPDGGLSAGTTFRIYPASIGAVAPIPTSTTGGLSVTGKASLNGFGPPNGAQVALASSNTALATVPASVTVEYEKEYATFSITTYGVASTTGVIIRATYNSITKSASLTLNPSVLTGVFVAPTTVTGGSSSSGAVALSGDAAPSGSVVKLSSDSVYAKVPVSVTIAALTTKKSFTITTTAPSVAQTAHISATYSGVTKTATLTINP